MTFGHRVSDILIGLVLLAIGIGMIRWRRDVAMAMVRKDPSAWDYRWFNAVGQTKDRPWGAMAGSAFVGSAVALLGGYLAVSSVFWRS